MELKNGPKNNCERKSHQNKIAKLLFVAQPRLSLPFWQMSIHGSQWDVRRSVEDSAFPGRAREREPTAAMSDRSVDHKAAPPTIAATPAKH